MSPVQIRNPAIVKASPRRWLRYHVNFYMNAPSPQEQPIPGLPLFDGLGQKTQFLSTSSS
ncbi:hypothetical protein N7470_003556 [Penicillium chermesinum]|nr:hypothetical protein N7470_003556 [Penicillium chermesinum]